MKGNKHRKVSYLLCAKADLGAVSAEGRSLSDMAARRSSELNKLSRAAQRASRASLWATLRLPSLMQKKG